MYRKLYLVTLDAKGGGAISAFPLFESARSLRSKAELYSSFKKSLVGTNSHLSKSQFSALLRKDQSAPGSFLLVVSEKTQPVRESLKLNEDTELKVPMAPLTYQDLSAKLPHIN